MGNRSTFLPVACSKVRVTGMLDGVSQTSNQKDPSSSHLPPSRVRSGFKPQTCSTALPAAEKFQCFGLATHHLPSCCSEASSLFLLFSLANSLCTCSYTSLFTSALSMLGTVRIENLPMTLAGMTVLAPGAEKAPSTPWTDREGYRHLPRHECQWTILFRKETVYLAINVFSLSS